MSNPNLMDIEPGGENTQYESIRYFTETPPKQTGQLGAHCEHTRSEYNPILGDEDDEGKEKNGDTPLALQLEKGEATSGLSGIVDKDSKPETPEEAAALAARIRREQGYGPGSGVGA
ncbi:hypothetical protein ASPACDRAFT_42364 [Aspergillus aculeatus ATCC 16872]|uniref:Uncharacterized protein n=1 Tax=Aspergillus aculeatus (strain ATCC 16872 / CBS 172.66 / WB 5094) TaxID=690307 RepID=A0A1L9WXH3_ASPA1|nr:uncharacterized protein ASPACDRAFT_42364 [Aspergillus aculeatus ATCC 16872]OJK00864.1 hypothetical protein ASPACDRAFT_42364 [Aspergillus aculeatus ATCC 16872]